VPIENQLILWIIRLPSVGKDPLPLFMEKSKEKSLVERMEEKVDTFRGARGLDVARINDDTISFVTHVLACKLLRKHHKYQVLEGVIETTEKCIA
jgi:hypothetical protein